MGGIKPSPKGLIVPRRGILMASTGSGGGAKVPVSFVAGADLGNNGGSTASYTHAFSVAVQTSSLLLVAIEGDAVADLITGVTYGGVPMILAAKQPTTFTSNRVTYLYYLLAPPTGANNVVISASGTTWMIAGAAQYAHVGGLDASNINVGANAAITSLTSSITTVHDKSLVVFVGNQFNGSVQPLAGTGDILRVADASFGTWGIFEASAVVTPAGAASFTTGLVGGASSQSIIHVLASFYPA